MTKDPVDQLNVELFKILRLRFAPRSHDKLGVCLQSEGDAGKRIPFRLRMEETAYGGRGSLFGPLAAGVVLVGFAAEEKLGDGNHGVTLTLKGFQNAGQSLRRVLCGVVEEDDAARAHIFQHAALNFLS